MAAIPALTPPQSSVLTQPYLTPAAFKAYPTWLDLDNLVPGMFEDSQDAELADVLLAASEACITLDEGRTMRLDGHYVQGEARQVPVNREARVTIRPRDVPVRAITSVSWGYDPSDMQADTLPNPTAWMTWGRQYSFRPGGDAAPVYMLPPPLFGPPQPRPFSRLFVNWDYVAGFPSTVLASSCTEAASALSLADATSVLPGDQLRFYDGASSEVVTVAAGYIPQVPTVPATVTSVPLSAPTQYAHEAAILCTGMPRAILQAVICFTVAFLMREDVSEEMPVDAFGTGRRLTEEGRGGQAGGLINDALGFLAPFRPGWLP
jgi:hypothetical protein